MSIEATGEAADEATDVLSERLNALHGSVRHSRSGGRSMCPLHHFSHAMTLHS